MVFGANLGVGGAVPVRLAHPTLRRVPGRRGAVVLAPMRRARWAPAAPSGTGRRAASGRTLDLGIAREATAAALERGLEAALLWWAGSGTEVGARGPPGGLASPAAPREAIMSVPGLQQLYSQLHTTLQRLVGPPLHPPPLSPPTHKRPPHPSPTLMAFLDHRSWQLHCSYPGPLGHLASRCGARWRDRAIE